MGKLNLLHHKSWHVWKRDNLEIVRKDEEKAQKGEELKDQRQFEIAQERKLEQMREQKYKSLTTNRTPNPNLIHIDSINKPKNTSAPNTHIKSVNLFADIDGTSKSTNEDHERELKQEKDRYEKQFTMTFESCAQRGANAPWYAKPDTLKSVEKSTKALKNKLVDVKRKERNDPMSKVPSSDTIHKSSTPTITSGTKTIDMLRKERLAREEDEKRRIIEAKRSKEPVQHQTEKSHYNSQFNPDFVRKAPCRPGYRPY